MKRKNETNLYDWVTNERGSRLIYSGRTPDRVDVGYRSSDEVLLSFLEKNILTGQALLDAQELFYAKRKNA